MFGRVARSQPPRRRSCGESSLSSNSPQPIVQPCRSLPVRRLDPVPEVTAAGSPVARRAHAASSARLRVGRQAAGCPGAGMMIACRESSRQSVPSAAAGRPCASCPVRQSPCRRIRSAVVGQCQKQPGARGFSSPTQAHAAGEALDSGSQRSLRRCAARKRSAAGKPIVAAPGVQHRQPVRASIGRRPSLYQCRGPGEGDSACFQPVAAEVDRNDRHRSEVRSPTRPAAECPGGPQAQETGLRRSPRGRSKY